MREISGIPLIPPSIGQLEEKILPLGAYSKQDIHLACLLANIGVKITNLPDGALLCKSFHIRFVRGALGTILALTDMMEDDACRLIYQEIKKNPNNDAVDLIMKIFQRPEFISAIGASQWIREYTGSYFLSDDKKKSFMQLLLLDNTPLKSFENFAHLNMSCIGRDGNYYLFSSSTGSGAPWLNGSHAFVEINPEDFHLTGDSLIDSPMCTKITLNKAQLSKGLKLQENPVIVINGDSIIKVGTFTSCISGKGVITIQGSGTLILKCRKYSSIIGTGAVSQSCGRYISPKDSPKITKIVIDGVALKVGCETPNFSLGNYGEENNIPVELINGGTVEGMPELLGRVSLKSVGTTSYGSTKIEGPAIYELKTTNNQTKLLDIF